MTEGQGDLLCLSFPLSLLISPNALNSGGLGAEPPCSIEPIYGTPLKESNSGWQEANPLSMKHPLP